MKNRSWRDWYYAACLALIVAATIATQTVIARDAASTGIHSSCDGPNRVYTSSSGLTVVKDDPRCTGAAG